MSLECSGPPSLYSLCLGEIAASQLWPLQRRKLERLPEHAADELLTRLLAQGSLSTPAQLDLFRYTASRVLVVPSPQPQLLPSAQAQPRGQSHHAAAGAWEPHGERPATASAAGRLQASPCARLVDASWVAHIADFSHLLELRLEGCPKLRGPALGPLAAPAAGAASSLTSLSLAGCSGVGAECIPALACLTALRDLDLSETGLRPPLRLGRLHPLTRLTSLALGGLPLLGDAAVSGEEEEEVEGKAGARAGSPSAAGCGDADEDGGSAAGGLCALGAAPLARLSLWGTRVGSPGLELLLGCAWPQLRELDLSWAAEVDVVPALPALRVLRMRSCQVTGVWWPAGAPPSLPTWTQGAAQTVAAVAAAAGEPCCDCACAQPTWLSLQHLDLGGCTVAPGAQVSLAGMLAAAAPSLQHVDLSGCSLKAVGLGWVHGLGSRGLCSACGRACASKGAVGLRELRLEGCGGLLGGRGPLAALRGACPALRVLSLAGCSSLGDGGIAALPLLPGLQELDVSGCDLSDVGLAHVLAVADPARLAHLRLDHNPRLTLRLPSPAATGTAARGRAGRQAGGAGAVCAGPAAQQQQQQLDQQQGGQGAVAAAVAAVWGVGQVNTEQQLGGTAEGLSEAGAARPASWEVRALQHLSCAGCGVTDDGIKALLRGLLRVASAAANAAAAAAAAGTPSAESQGSGSTADAAAEGGRRDYAGWPALQHLVLGGGGVSEAGLRLLVAMGAEGHLPHLSCLELRGCTSLGLRALRTVRKMGGLRRLVVDGVPAQGPGLGQLQVLLQESVGLEEVVVLLLGPQGAAPAGGLHHRAAVAGRGPGQQGGMQAGGAANVRVLRREEAASGGASCRSNGQGGRGGQGAGRKQGPAAAAAAAAAAARAALDERMRYSSEELLSLRGWLLRGGDESGGGQAWVQAQAQAVLEAIPQDLMKCA